MRLSFLMFLMLLTLPAGTSRDQGVARKVGAAVAEPDPCADAAPGTVLCGRLRVPVG
jgi:hypothetical protein